VYPAALDLGWAYNPPAMPLLNRAALSVRGKDLAFEVAIRWLEQKERSQKASKCRDRGRDEVLRVLDRNAPLARVLI
jgi:hypothetical protein